MNLFAISRPDVASHFSEYFKGYGSIQNRAMDNDIFSYLDSRLTTSRGSRLHKFTKLQEDIRKRLVEAADGMYVYYLNP